MSNTLFGNFPLGMPPKGVKSNFNAKAEGAVMLWVLNFLTLSLVIITVCIRFYVKRFVSKQKFSWDDGFCFAAMVSASSSLAFFPVADILSTSALPSCIPELSSKTLTMD